MSGGGGGGPDIGRGGDKDLFGLGLPQIKVESLDPDETAQQLAAEGLPIPEADGVVTPSEPVVGHRLTVSYLGTHFAGWQQQPEKETVQGHLERAVAKIYGVSTSVQGSGRTDAGVHALAQVASFLAPQRHSEDVLRRALNNNLPESIRVLEAQIVPDTFHARFDSTGKTYHYHILNSPLADPFRSHLCFHVPRPLDVPAMRAAAAHLLGIHDFSSFASNPGYARTTMVRTMHCVELDVVSEVAQPYGVAREIVLRVTADGFLYRMVRNIVGALLKVGHARMSPDDFRNVLQAARRTAAPNTAPPHGLYMARVYYGDEMREELQRKCAELKDLDAARGLMRWEGSEACFAAGARSVSTEHADSEADADGAEASAASLPTAPTAPARFDKNNRRPRRIGAASE